MESLRINPQSIPLLAVRERAYMVRELTWCGRESLHGERDWMEQVVSGCHVPQ